MASSFSGWVSPEPGLLPFTTPQFNNASYSTPPSVIADGRVVGRSPIWIIAAFAEAWHVNNDTIANANTYRGGKNRGAVGLFMVVVLHLLAGVGGSLGTSLRAVIVTMRAKIRAPTVAPHSTNDWGHCQEEPEKPEKNSWAVRTERPAGVGVLVPELGSQATRPRPEFANQTAAS